MIFREADKLGDIRKCVAPDVFRVFPDGNAVDVGIGRDGLNVYERRKIAAGKTSLLTVRTVLTLTRKASAVVLSEAAGIGFGAGRKRSPAFGAEARRRVVMKS